MTYTFASTTTTITLTPPVEAFNLDENRNVIGFHFWDDSDKVVDTGKSSRAIMLSGVETDDAYDKMSEFDWIAEAGDEVTISGFDDDNIDTTWYIEDFSYNVEGGTPSVTFWNVTLEKSESP